MINSFKLLIIFVIFTTNNSLLAQDNLIIEKRLQMEYIINPANSNDSTIYFEDAITHPNFGNTPLIKIQVELENEFDSIEIAFFETQKQKINIQENQYHITQNITYIIEYQKSNQKILATIFINPLIKENNQINFHNYLKIFITHYKRNIKEGKGGVVWANNSILSSGDWYKVRLSKSGIYKVTASHLQNMGYNLSTLLTSQIKLYGNGGGMYPEANHVFFHDDLVENPIEIHDINNNGLFDGSDYFLFYAQGPHPWRYSTITNTFQHSQHLYDNYAYYFITANAEPSKRIQSQTVNSSTPTHIITSFNDFQYIDKDSINLIKSGKLWFGDEFNILTNYSYSFNFSNLVTTSPVRIKTSVAARSTTNSTFNLNTNGTTNQITVPGIVGTYNSDYAAASTQQYDIFSNKDLININISYTKSTTSSIGWLDYIEVFAERHLKMSGNQMIFRNTSSIGSGNISKYELSNASTNLKIWEITNPVSPTNIPYTINNGVINFIHESDSLREYIAHNGGYYEVSFVEKIANQNLHSYSDVDYIICYNKKFINQVNDLANYHRNNSNLNVITIDQNLLFNEFSGGAVDIAALRNFMRMLYDKANENGSKTPKYLLLFGDASYDYKNRVNKNTNYVLTFESTASLSPINSYSSDDFFGLLDQNEGIDCNGALDIAIGRFPVSSISEATNLVDKVKRYEAKHNNPLGDNNNLSLNSTPNMADWRNVMCFIGDDQDQNVHITQSDFMAESITNSHPVYNIDKIYLDAYVQKTTPGGQRYPEAKNDLNLRVSSGALVINYTGHGGEIGLAHESLLEVNDILKWSNKDNLPLFITATCEFSRYDDPSRISAGEYTYLQANGGMIALLTTSRLTFSSSNYTLNKYILNVLKSEQNGEYLSMGEIIRQAKVSAGSIMNNRNFVLLGDPCLKLSRPEFEVSTKTINGKPIDQFSDTISSLSKITITGQIEENGVKISNFNGYVYPTVYDKPQTYTTLGNDPDSYPYNFKIQKNIIYKGKATVVNGEFTFSFLTPKDINYSIGYGKISYYAENGQIDANGYYDSLLIGGTSSNNIVDNEGPRIQLFMNDTFFVDGGLTDENPVLLAFLADSNGINTTGNGIGHDITLILDQNTAKSITLNSFYRAKTNSYQEGYIIYPLSSLSNGNHSITLKAWDILNNSNTELLNFIVANSETSMISSIINYPNPFSDFTNFVFEHNMAGNTMNIRIEIYDLNGQSVRTLSTTITNSGYKIAPEELRWNGLNENGQKLSSGIYNYKLYINTDLGNVESKGGKLVLLK